jgi:glutamyl-tRNA synthetase/nondiscriminating glutamyl-tRNA synthetase
MSRPRVRFAPSPTGQLHVGNARTALFNWAFARRHGGTLILRIEDTDRERSTAESETAMLDDLRWLGLDWDEGPGAPGEFGPYRQSERLDLYAARARELLAGGRAYYCFCSPDQLDAERTAAYAAGQPPKYSGRCRALDAAESARRVAGGEGAAIRFAVPPGRDVAFEDLVRGPVSFNTDIIGDPVIVRSGGHPAYNFAVVVDDIAMQISHVIRGEDHLSNTPRQLLIYEALGHAVPVFAHLSLVLGPDHAPLSKRHGATSVLEFRDRGYLPEALGNYLALLGWSPGDNQELMSMAEIARRFDFGHVSHSAAVFDVDKLAWVNRHYMKEAPAGRLAREALRYFVQAGYVTLATDASLQYLESLLPLGVASVDRLEDLPARVAFVFDWEPGRAAALAGAEASGAAAVRAFADEIAAAGRLDRDAFRAAAGRARDRSGLKGRALFHAIRAAVTGADTGPELDLAIPAIDRAAALGPGAGLVPVKSCAERAREVAAILAGEA